MANITPNQSDAITDLCAADPGPRAREHRVRAIDADQGDAGAAERQCNPACAASELQRAAAGVQRDIAPERHVAAAEGTRVLPVIEGGVLVPAFPALLIRSFGQQSRREECSGFRRT